MTMETTTAGRRGNGRRGVAAIRWIIVAGSVVGLGAAAYAIWMPSEGAERAAAYELTADRAVAKRASFDVATTANGELDSKTKIELRSKLDKSATIQSIVPEGTLVKAGDLLVQLNTDALQQRIDQERPRVSSARADLVAAENAVNIQLNDNASALRKAELALEIADLTLEQWLQGDVAKKRQQLDLRIDKAALELERLAQRYIQSQKLLAEEFLSKDECDRDEVAYIQAISDYTTSHLEKEVYESYEFVMQQKQKRSDVEEKKGELERTRLNNTIQLVSKEASLVNKKEQVAILEQMMKKLQEQLGWATIKAPSGGMVVYSTSIEGMRWGGNDGPLQIGQQIHPNQLVIALPDTSEMVAAVRVHESLAGRVRPGQAASVKIEAAGGRVFEGKVDSIGVMAEGGGWRDPNLREYVVRIALDTQGESLKPAMRCEARMILDTVPDALTVPIQAVFSEGPVQFVYAPRGAKFARVPVRVGRRSDTLAEVTAGLEESRTVLLREPSPGEVLSEPWKPAELKLAGYETDAEGKVVLAAGKSGGGRGPRSGGKPGAGAPPALAAVPKDAAEPATDVVAVEATPAADTEPVTAPAVTTQTAEATEK